MKRVRHTVSVTMRRGALCIWAALLMLPCHTATVLAAAPEAPAAQQAPVREYHLEVAYKTVRLGSGEESRAMAVNDSIPAPVLRFRVGQLARIHVRNRMDVETSVHWHGLLLPNSQDGVPYLTTPPIAPGAVARYEFPLRHAGTYWYHSHTGLQEQRGVYGAIVIEPAAQEIPPPERRYDRELVLVLSDWNDEPPDKVLRTLKRNSHYYAHKKGATQSVLGALRSGALGESVAMARVRMPPMDISDVGYDYFLSNGAPRRHFPAQAGERILVRIINAAASTYFYLDFAGGAMQVISADGLDVAPWETGRFLMAIAETYDVLLQVPPEGAHELRASAQDGSGATGVFIGNGERVVAPPIPQPDLYRMHAGHAMHAGHTGPASQTHANHDSAPQAHATHASASQAHANHAPAPQAHATHAPAPQAHADHASAPQAHATHAPAPQTHATHAPSSQAPAHHAPAHASASAQSPRPLAPYEHLRALRSTALPKGRPWKTHTLRLSGDMERYVWMINDRTLSRAPFIKIRKGENVRFVLENETMMHHPMHLHGHFFRVRNGQGDYAPLKHTVDVPPLGQRTIEFQAEEDQDWFFHCHILYHMAAGMARVVHYEQPGEEGARHAAARMSQLRATPLMRDPVYLWGAAQLLSQQGQVDMRLENTRNSLELSWQQGWEAEHKDEPAMREGVMLYRRYHSRFLSGFAGLAYDEHLKERAVVGLDALLPWRFESRLWVDGDGEARLALHRAWQLSDHLESELEYHFDTATKSEWQIQLSWGLSRALSLVAAQHSETGAGLGLHWSW